METERGKSKKEHDKKQKGESGKGEKIQYIIPGTIPVEHAQKFTSSREFVVLSRGVPDRPVVWVQSNVESICYIFIFYLISTCQPSATYFKNSFIVFIACFFKILI